MHKWSDPSHNVVLISETSSSRLCSIWTMDRYRSATRARDSILRQWVQSKRDNSDRKIIHVCTHCEKIQDFNTAKMIAHNRHISNVKKLKHKFTTMITTPQVEIRTEPKKQIELKYNEQHQQHSVLEQRDCARVWDLPDPNSNPIQQLDHSCGDTIHPNHFPLNVLPWFVNWPLMMFPSRWIKNPLRKRILTLLCGRRMILFKMSHSSPTILGAQRTAYQPRIVGSIFPR